MNPSQSILDGRGVGGFAASGGSEAQCFVQIAASLDQEEGKIIENDRIVRRLGQGFSIAGDGLGWLAGLVLNNSNGSIQVLALGVELARVLESLESRGEISMAALKISDADLDIGRLRILVRQFLEFSQGHIRFAGRFGGGNHEGRSSTGLRSALEFSLGELQGTGLTDVLPHKYSLSRPTDRDWHRLRDRASGSAVLRRRSSFVAMR